MTCVRGDFSSIFLVFASVIVCAQLRGCDKSYYNKAALVGVVIDNPEGGQYSPFVLTCRTHGEPGPHFQAWFVREIFRGQLARGFRVVREEDGTVVFTVVGRVDKTNKSVQTLMKIDARVFWRIKWIPNEKDFSIVSDPPLRLVGRTTEGDAVYEPGTFQIIVQKR